MQAPNLVLCPENDSIFNVPKAPHEAINSIQAMLAKVNGVRGCVRRNGTPGWNAVEKQLATWNALLLNLHDNIRELEQRNTAFDWRVRWQMQAALQNATDLASNVV